MTDLRYALDVPDAHGGVDSGWVNIDYYETREEAIAAAAELFGADADGRIGLVSELPEEGE